MADRSLGFNISTSEDFTRACAAMQRAAEGFERQLARLDGRTVNIRAEADTARATAELVALHEIASRLDKAFGVSQLQGFSGQLLMAAKAGGALTAVLLALGPAASLVAAGAVGIFAGIGIAAAAQSTAVQSAFASMANGVRTRVESMAAPIVPVLVNIAGMITATFNQIAPSIGAAFRAVAPMIQTLAAGVLSAVTQIVPALSGLAQAAGPTIQVISTGIANLGAALAGFIRNLQVGLAGSAQALAGLFQVINGILPLLGTLIGQVGILAGPVFSALAPVLVNIASIFVNVLIVALQQFAPILIALIPLVNQVAIVLGGVLTDVFRQLGPPILQIVIALSNALMPILPALGQAFTAIILAVAPLVSILSALAPAFGAIVNAATSVVIALAPVISILGNALGQVLAALAPMISQLATMIGQFLVQAIVALTPAINILVQVFSQVAVIVGQVLIQAVTALAPILLSLVTIFGQVVVTVAPLITVFAQITAQLLTALMPAVTIIGNAFVTVFQAILNAVQPLMPIIIQIVTVVGQTLAQAITALMPIVSALANAFVQVVQALIPLLPPLLQLVQSLLPAFSTILPVIANVISNVVVPVLTFLVSALVAVINVMVTVVSTIATGLTNLINYFSNFGANITQFWTTTWNNISAFGQQIWNAIAGFFTASLTNFQTQWNTVWTAVSNLWNTIWNAIFGFAQTIWNAIAGFFTSSLANFQAQWSAVWNAVQQTFLTIFNAIRDASIVIWNTIKSVFQTAMDGLRIAWQAFWDTLKSVATTVFNAIKGTIDTVIGGIITAFHYVVDNVTTIWNGIRSALAAPINFMIGTVYNDGIVRAWNFVSDLLGIGKINPIALIPTFATGGEVRGPGNGTSDSIVARLSNGEYVMPAAVNERHHGFLEALRAGQPEAVQAAGGAFSRMPGFAAGGDVGAAIARAKSVASAMDGKPYIWGGAGPNGADCSGYQSIITNALRGDPNPYHRIGTTETFPWGGFAGGLGGSYAIGAYHGNPGHMAGTLDGINVESGGSHGNVAFGGPAAGADASRFNIRAFLPEIGGQFASGGSGGGFFNWILQQVKAIYTAITDPIPAALTALIGSPPPQFLQVPPAMANKAISAVGDFLFGKAEVVGGGPNTGPSGGAAGTGPVWDQIQQTAMSYGWGDGANWAAIQWIVDHESGGNPSAQNPTSTAFGLFQLLDGTWAGTGVAKTSNPALQAQAGLNYIRSRYGTPTAAQAFWQSHGYYDAGGVASGPGFIPKLTNAPERVLSPQQSRAFDAIVPMLDRVTGGDGAALMSALGPNGSRRPSGFDGSGRVVDEVSALRGDVQTLRAALSGNGDTFNIYAPDAQEGAHASRMLLRSLR